MKISCPGSHLMILLFEIGNQTAGEWYEPRHNLDRRWRDHDRHVPSCEIPRRYRPARCCRECARASPAWRRGRPARSRKPCPRRWRAFRPDQARRKRHRSCGENTAGARRPRSTDRRSLPCPRSNRPDVACRRSSHPLQEHADMRRQHAAIAMQQRDRGIAHLAIAGAPRHLQMGFSQMRHRAADAAMAVTQ